MASWNLELIEKSFADAATDPTLWINAMDTIAKETDSIGAVLIPMRGGTLPNVPASESVLRTLERYFRDGWHARDERFRTFDTLARCGVVDDFDFTNSDEMKRHPYFQEFLRPSGLKYFAGVKMSAGDDLWCVSIQRSESQGPVSPEGMQKLAITSQRIASAAALARALSFASSNGAVEALELSNSAVALFDRNGQVMRLNRKAETLLGGDLKVTKSRLTSYDHNATAALDRALRSLLWIGTTSALMPPVILPRRERRSILAYPVRLSSVSSSIFANCQAMLVLIDLESRPRPPHGALKVAFALTPAEARLAIKICSGESLDKLADELTVSRDTARSQLKSIFQKTGVHRQSELVALLASFLQV